MTAQCNFCGSIKDIGVCPHCDTAICAGCRAHHVSYCGDLKKLKIDGHGKTVRNS